MSSTFYLLTPCDLFYAIFIGCLLGSLGPVFRRFVELRYIPPRSVIDSKTMQIRAVF